MKKYLTLLLILMCSVALASPTTTITIPTSFSPNTKIYSSAVNSDFTEVQSKFNSHSHTDITELGSVTVGNWLATLVGTQYGGTGKDLSGASQGCVLFVSATGTISQLTPGTSGYWLKTNGTVANPTWAAGGDNSDQIVRGFEVDAMTTSTVAVQSGDLFYGTTRINKTASTTLTFATANNWWDGQTHLGVATYSYIGVGSGGGIKLLWNRKPNVADSNGLTTQGAALYYASRETTAGVWDYWRVIGRVSLSAANVVDQKYVQIGNTVYFQKGISVSVPTVHDAWGKVDLRTITSYIDGEAQMSAGAYGVAGTYQAKPTFVTSTSYAGTTIDAESNGGQLGWVYITNGANPIAYSSVPSVMFKSSYNGTFPATITAVKLTIR